MEKDAAVELLKELGEWQTRDEFVYRQRCRPGMLAMWDNRSVLHKATGGHEGYDRLPKILIRLVRPSAQPPRNVFGDRLPGVLGLPTHLLDQLRWQTKRNGFVPGSWPARSCTRPSVARQNLGSHLATDLDGLIRVLDSLLHRVPCPRAQQSAPRDRSSMRASGCCAAGRGSSPSGCFHDS